MSRGRQCAVLVGGKGTRLGSLTSDCPKPLLQVGGSPFLEHLLRKFAHSGFDDIILLAGYKAAMVRDFAKRMAASLDLRIRVVEEPQPAGTAGPLLYARDLLADEFMLTNGDSLFDIDLQELATRPVEGKWVGRLALRKTDETSRYGTIKLQGDLIVEFLEKSGSRGGGLINGGVYWLRRDVIDYIGEPPCSMEEQVFPVLAGRGLLRGWTWDGMFVDIGVPEDLERLRAEWGNQLSAASVCSSSRSNSHGSG